MKGRPDIVAVGASRDEIRTGQLAEQLPDDRRIVFGEPRTTSRIEHTTHELQEVGNNWTKGQVNLNITPQNAKGSDRIGSNWLFVI